VALKAFSIFPEQMNVNVATFYHIGVFTYKRSSEFKYREWRQKLNVILK